MRNSKRTGLTWEPAWTYGEEPKVGITEDRRQFLEIACRMYPPIIRRLRSEVLPLWTKAAREFHSLENPSFDPSVDMCDLGAFTKKNVDHAKSGRPSESYEALKHWARSLHLDVAWVIDSAVEQLQHWAEDEIEGEEGDPNGRMPTDEWFILTDEYIEKPLRWVDEDFPSIYPWNPAQETEQEFDRRIAKYKDQQKLWAHNRGLVPIRYKKEISHFVWLTLWHFGGWSGVKISRWWREQENEIRTHGAVTDAVARLQKRLGLPQRMTSGRRKPSRPRAPKVVSED